MFDRLLTTEFNTKRLTDVAETSRTTYTDHLTLQRGMLQPFGDMEEMAGGNKIGQMFKLFCNRIDIRVSDKIIVGSTEYIVKTIKDFNYGAFPHKEAIIVEQ